ncbi:MAG: hypothetical protein C0485_18005 [Pirellula sp.]|nr:hypothetical protein [Pirellula sp.]
MVLLAIVLAGAHNQPTAIAADAVGQVAVDAGEGAVSLSRQGAWHLAESDNFQVCSLHSAEQASAMARACERLRREVAELCGLRVERWSPRCQIVLHASSTSYVAAVGNNGAATVASALTKRGGARIALRKIDVRGDAHDYLTTALPHELCHVLLADRFTDAPLWCDEGLALLLDPLDKQQLHERDLRIGQQRGELMPLDHLVNLKQYPAAQRWGLFYGQSASIVRYLLQRGTPAQLLEFAELQRSRGVNVALRDVYGFQGVAELDRQWQASLKNSLVAPITLIGFAGVVNPLSAIAESP